MALPDLRAIHSSVAFKFIQLPSEQLHNLMDSKVSRLFQDREVFILLKE